MDLIVPLRFPPLISRYLVSRSDSIDTVVGMSRQSDWWRALIKCKPDVLFFFVDINIPNRAGIPCRDIRAIIDTIHLPIILSSGPKRVSYCERPITG